MSAITLTNLVAAQHNHGVREQPREENNGLIATICKVSPFVLGLIAAIGGSVALGIGPGLLIGGAVALVVSLISWGISSLSDGSERMPQLPLGFLGQAAGLGSRAIQQHMAPGRGQPVTRNGNVVAGSGTHIPGPPVLGHGQPPVLVVAQPNVAARGGHIPGPAVLGHGQPPVPVVAQPNLGVGAGHIHAPVPQRPIGVPAPQPNLGVGAGHIHAPVPQRPIGVPAPQPNLGVGAGHIQGPPVLGHAQPPQGAAAPNIGVGQGRRHR